MSKQSNTAASQPVNQTAKRRQAPAGRQAAITTDYSRRVFVLAGDSLAFHNGMGFTTKDYDVDGAWGGNCAYWMHGAWWYNYCHHSKLNGKYLFGGNVPGKDQGIQWVTWTGGYYSVKSCQLKIHLLA